MDLRYWIGFNLVKGIGPARVRRLLDYFGDLALAWQAAPEALSQAGLDRRGRARVPWQRAPQSTWTWL